MNTSLRPSLRLITVAVSSAILFTAFSNAARAADANAARVTFDGAIRNNSLALSPDESMAVVSYGERSDVIAYDLKSGMVRGTLSSFVTPRNIVSSPDGKVLYISDSSLGEVVKIASTTLKPLSSLPAGGE